MRVEVVAYGRRPLTPTLARSRGEGARTMTIKIRAAEPDDYEAIRELTVYIDNPGALALYRKSGFEVEGTLRRYAFRDGQFIDAYMMSRLKDI